jgi:hypothetical protein
MNLHEMDELAPLVTYAEQYYQTTKSENIKRNILSENHHKGLQLGGLVRRMLGCRHDGARKGSSNAR